MSSCSSCQEAPSNSSRTKIDRHIHCDIRISVSPLCMSWSVRCALADNLTTTFGLFVLLQSAWFIQRHCFVIRITWRHLSSMTLDIQHTRGRHVILCYTSIQLTNSWVCHVSNQPQSQWKEEYFIIVTNGTTFHYLHQIDLGIVQQIPLGTTFFIVAAETQTSAVVDRLTCQTTRLLVQVCTNVVQVQQLPGTTTTIMITTLNQLTLDDVRQIGSRFIYRCLWGTL